MQYGVHSTELEEMLAWLACQAGPIYLVGGWVRDRLLGRVSHDLDLAVPSGGRTLARRLADRFDGRYYTLDEERDTGRVLLGQGSAPIQTVDVACFRAATLESDLLDRDFTVNAMASPVQNPSQVIDPAGGLADLRAGLIRVVHDAALVRDPVRSLRAVRQAAELGFSMEAGTELLAREASALLWRASGERLRDELVRLLEPPTSHLLMRRLDRLGLLSALFPGLEACRDLHQTSPHIEDVLKHLLSTLEALEELLSAEEPIGPWLAPYLSEPLTGFRPRYIMIKLAALLHDVGKPGSRSSDEGGRVRFLGHDQAGAEIVRTMLQRFHFGTAEIALAVTIVRHHSRPLQLAQQETVSARAIYRFFRDSGDAGPAALLVAMADQAAICPPEGPRSDSLRLQALAQRMLQDYFELHGVRIAPTPLLRGHDLLREFPVAPGPRIGELLELVREAQAAGEVQTREEALDLVRACLGKR